MKNNTNIECVTVRKILSEFKYVENQLLLNEARKLTYERASLIVRAIILNCPITPMVLKYKIIDGEGHMIFLTKYEIPMALQLYTENKFKVVVNKTSKYFEELDDEELSKFWYSSVRCYSNNNYDQEYDPVFLHCMEQL